MHPSIEGFWAFVNERETVRCRKETHDVRPWSKDRVLNEYHFCNIRRKDDYGTRWYLQMIADRQPSNQDVLSEVLWRTMLYRLVNNTAWFEQLAGNRIDYEHRQGVFTYEDWCDSSVRKYWRERILRNAKPHSPAYIVLQAPGSTGRARQLIRVLDELRPIFIHLSNNVYGAASLEAAWTKLKEPYGMGPFIALQVVRDLLLVKALRDPGGVPFNENDWTFLGPGAREGLQVLALGERPMSGDGSRYGASYKVQYELCLKLHAEQPGWLAAVEPLVLGDVEHCLCEYNKYVRVTMWKKGGRRPRLRYFKSHELQR